MKSDLSTLSAPFLPSRKGEGSEIQRVNLVGLNRDKKGMRRY